MISDLSGLFVGVSVSISCFTATTTYSNIARCTKDEATSLGSRQVRFTQWMEDILHHFRHPKYWKYWGEGGGYHV